MNDIDPLLTIKEQNYWLRKKTISIARRYTVTTAKGGYSNIILNCDVGTLKLILDRITILFGFAEKKAYEYVEILQCYKCLRFVHISVSCNSAQACRNWGEAHERCENLSYKCINCERNNKKGFKFSTHHKATDERCPSCINRIENLKVYLSKN